MAMLTRQVILEKLRNKIVEGQPIVGGGAGTVLPPSAKRLAGLI